MGRPATRQIRSLRYGLLIGLVCGVVLAPLWTSSSHRWVSSATTAPVAGVPNVGTATRAIGFPPYLVIEETDVLVNGAAGTKYTWSWTWHRWRLTGLIVATLLALYLGRRLHGQLVRRGRLTEHCDECGYDISAVASDRCPECGLVLHRPGTSPQRM